jgi:hypothetical protein
MALGILTMRCFFPPQPHPVTYLRLLDADGVDWQEMANIVLHIDPKMRTESCKVCMGEPFDLLRGAAAQLPNMPRGIGLPWVRWRSVLGDWLQIVIWLQTARGSSDSLR